jgi:CheY-like chemotaxis protein
MLNGKRILVVEDEFVVSMMLEDVLTDAGAMVLGPVVSVRDALGLLDVAMLDGGVSAAVLDLRLGRENGIVVADALRKRGVPYVFTTGLGEFAELEQHEDAPVLAKPYSLQGLMRTLEKLLLDGNQFMISPDDARQTKVPETH